MEDTTGRFRVGSFFSRIPHLSPMKPMHFMENGFSITSICCVYVMLFIIHLFMFDFVFVVFYYVTRWCIPTLTLYQRCNVRICAFPYAYSNLCMWYCALYGQVNKLLFSCRGLVFLVCKESCQKNDKQLIVSSDLSMLYHPAATFSCLVYEDKKCLKFQLLLMEDWKSCDSWLGFFHQYSSSLPGQKWSSTTLVLGRFKWLHCERPIGNRTWALRIGMCFCWF